MCSCMWPGIDGHISHEHSSWLLGQAELSTQAKI